MDQSTSSIIETVDPIPSNNSIPSNAIPSKKDENKPSKYYTYVLSLVVVVVVIGLMYHSYSCYCSNQDLYNEGFTEETVKSGTDSDLSFDVDDQINKLTNSQEKYLDNKPKTK
jgi:hypothetical protein